MIKIGTILKVIDNSGVKFVKCIQILKKQNGKVGDFIVVSVIKLRENLINKKFLKIKKKEIFKALIVKTKNIIKKTGIKIYFKMNSVILLDKQNNPLSTRILGFIPKFLKKKFLKLISISFKNF